MDGSCAVHSRRKNCRHSSRMKKFPLLPTLLAASLPFLADGADPEGYVPLGKAVATTIHAAPPTTDGQSGYLGAAVEMRDGGLWVMEVAMDSAAQHAGLQKGDRILTLDATAVK